MSSRRRLAAEEKGAPVKGSQKPKTQLKKPATKTLKERRTEKRTAAKHQRLDV